MAKVTLHKHEAIPQCGSFEVRFYDGRASVYFYWDDDRNRGRNRARKWLPVSERVSKCLRLIADLSQLIGE